MTRRSYARKPVVGTVGLLAAALLCVLPVGCTRSYWRRNADAEAYGLIREKTALDGRWAPPRTDVIADPRSRLYDPYDPDFGPLPADDPTARVYLGRIGDCNRIHGSRYWSKIGMAATIENPAWIPALAAEQAAPGRLPAGAGVMLSDGGKRSGLDAADAQGADAPRSAGAPAAGRATVQLASFQQRADDLPPPPPSGTESARELLDAELGDPLKELPPDPGAAEDIAPRGDDGPNLAAANPALPAVEDLTLAEAVRLSYLHSRDYQTTIENVYLAALDLAFQRFQFDIRFLGLTGGRPSGSTTFTDVPRVSDGVTTGNRIGISRLLPAGGQYAVELANSTLWLFSGGNQGGGTTTALSYSFVQPLLLGAGRKVVLENLTQAERSLLYATRDLARFRQSFFVATVTGGQSGGYLGLLQQIQSIANLQDNIARLEEQLEITRAQQLDVLSEAQLESQLLSNLNRVRISRQQLQDSLDQFKIQLGLPPDLSMTLDVDLLRPFRLIDGSLKDVERAVTEEFLAAWSPLDPDDPDPAGLRATIDLLQALTDRLRDEALTGLDADVAAVADALPGRLALIPDPAARQRVLDNVARDRAALRQTQGDYDETAAAVARLADALTAADTAAARGAVYKGAKETQERLLRITRNFQGVQVGLRTELIELNPFDLSIEEAVGYALANRVDLMNQRALVTDARRKVEVGANQLQAGLNVRVEGDVRTPGLNVNDNPLDFRGVNSSYRAGVEFVAPLDQIAQRNNYRALQISYQRTRRDYMLFEDNVKFSVRTSWRQLEVLKQNFEVARNAVRVAALQYDLAVEEANAPLKPNAGGGGGGGGGSSSGRAGLNIIQALNNLLSAQNQLISFWINYESARLAIYRDMGIMEVDAQGMWVDPFYQEGLASASGGAVDPAARRLEGREDGGEADGPGLVPPAPISPIRTAPAGVQPSGDGADGGVVPPRLPPAAPPADAPPPTGPAVGRFLPAAPRPTPPAPPAKFGHVRRPERVAPPPTNG